VKNDKKTSFWMKNKPKMVKNEVAIIVHELFMNFL